MNAALEVGEWSAARPGHTLPSGKTRYPFYRRLGGTQGQSGRAENLVPTGIRSRTVQPGSSVAIPTELPGRRCLNLQIMGYINYVICITSSTIGEVQFESQKGQGILTFSEHPQTTTVLPTDLVLSKDLSYFLLDKET